MARRCRSCVAAFFGIGCSDACHLAVLPGAEAPRGKLGGDLADAGDADRGEDGIRLAITRVAANVAGACVAVAALQIGGSAILAILVAMLLVGVICHLAYLDDGLRSANVCVAIVMAADRLDTLSPPLDRIASVAFGSLVGVGVPSSVETLEQRWARWRGSATSYTEK